MDEPIKIVLAGAAGRMGRIITALIEAEPGFILAGAVDVPDRLKSLAELPCPVADSVAKALEGAPGAVLVDFTSANAALANAEIAANFKTPMVIGATGIGAAQKKRLRDLAAETPILCSANMSVGINALLSVLPKLVHALGPEYDLEVMELHHKRKKDAPSGTALMLAEALAKARDWDLEHARISSRDGMTGPRSETEIGVQALRGGDVVGIHTVYLLGPGEFIEITHQAESRENFGQGALRAARWLAGRKPGKLYSMEDVIGD